MKTKIADHQTLLLEKQRLKLVCADQEKEMSANFILLRKKLNPTLMIREALLEMIPREIRENRIVSFISSLFGEQENQKQGGGIFSLLTSAFLNALLKFLNKK